MKSHRRRVHGSVRALAIAAPLVALGLSACNSTPNGGADDRDRFAAELSTAQNSMLQRAFPIEPISREQFLFLYQQAREQAVLECRRDAFGGASQPPDEASLRDRWQMMSEFIDCMAARGFPVDEPFLLFFDDR